MRLSYYQPLANGIRTDHPIPDLPFVDDAHIPVEDGRAVEALGRHEGPGWGRYDRYRDSGWVAFSTDQEHLHLAWVVRWHPKHGRSVLLVRDEDAASVHSLLLGPTLLLRSGGYWWDGVTWFRLPQVWDRASEEYLRRPVPAATTVTARDLLAQGEADPGRGQLLRLADFGAPDGETEPDEHADGRGRKTNVEEDLDGAGAQAARPAVYAGRRWRDHLAMWAARRQAQGSPDLPGLDACVVGLTAPELTADQLVGASEMAAIANVSASTVRAYVARGEADIPQPQGTINGRNVWARTVAEEWAEARRRSSDGVKAAVATERFGIEGLAPGVAHVWERLTDVFLERLWHHPDQRKRWALRWRNRETALDLAQDLSWSAAADITHIVPIDAVSATIRHAFLHEFVSGQQTRRYLKRDPEEHFYGVEPGVARMLDWLIRFHPSMAGATIGEIIGDAERDLDVPRHVSEDSIRTALQLDGTLDKNARREFLDRVLTPSQSLQE